MRLIHLSDPHLSSLDGVKLRDILGKRGLRAIFKSGALDARFEPFLDEATDEVIAEVSAMAPAAWENAGESRTH